MTAGTGVSAFSTPSKELVAHAVRELDYADRIVVYAMNSAVGSQETICYSLADVTKTLFKTQWSNLLSSGTKLGLNWVRPEKLVAWVRGPIGDREFADALEQALAGQNCYRDQVMAMEPVFAERLQQYREVWEADEQADAGRGVAAS